MEKVCVLGLGYIGLPTACILSTHGYKVLGVDTNVHRVQMINSGHLPIIEPGLNTLLEAAINSGCSFTSVEPEPADIFIITVPTPITNEKKVDLSFVEEAAKSIVPVLRKGNLVVLESTSPPCTTKNFLSPLLEESGLKVGEEIFVAYCPERVIPGHTLKELIENSRIIGGVNDRSGLEAKKIYSRFVKGEIHLTNSITAEMVKLVENTFRDVNIALANELAIICEKLSTSVWEVIKLANHHPRVNVHLPGPGVGGHCLAVDPWFIVDGFPEEAKIISLGRRINDNMPGYVYSKILNTLEGIENPQITIMGVSYKANIDDTRESPALSILKMMERKRLRFKICDPHVKDFKYELSNSYEAFRESDMLLFIADHEEFKYLQPLEIGKLMRHRIIIDTRNCIDRDLWRKYGFKVLLLGCN